jgi:hypothetical protein
MVAEFPRVEQAINTRRAVRQLVSLSYLYANGYFKEGGESLYPPNHKLNRNVAIWKGDLYTLEVFYLF